MQFQHTIVLMSGGIDSTATLAILQDKENPISGLFIDYGQPAAESEWQAVKRVAAHYEIPIEKLHLEFELRSKLGEFFGRNALFVLIAAAIRVERPLRVAIGIHALTEYYDTTPVFARHMRSMLDGYSGGDVTLWAPFLADTKPEVVRSAMNLNVPINLTYSCEWQNAPPCGRCPSCNDRNGINA